MTNFTVDLEAKGCVALLTARHHGGNVTFLTILSFQALLCLEMFKYCQIISAFKMGKISILQNCPHAFEILLFLNAL